MRVRPLSVNNDDKVESTILAHAREHTSHVQALYSITSKYQRTIGPENAHQKPDLGVLSHNEMTLTLNTHTPLLTSLVVCICKVSGLRLQ